MTEETYTQAAKIKYRIEHIERVIDYCKLNLESPTHDKVVGSIRLDDASSIRELTGVEVAAILDALIDYRKELIMQFETL